MATAPAPAKPRNPLVPPEERFWIRYSPHAEAPLSGVGSVAIHLLVVGFLALAVVLAGVFGWSNPPRSLPIETVRLPGGGGGNPKGVGDGPGIGTGAREDVSNTSEDTTPSEPSQRPPLTPEEVNKIKLDFADNPGVARYVADGGSENMKMLSRLDKEVRDKLRDGITPGKGKGGTGSGGGSGTGTGTGTGPGSGDGKQALNRREQRMLRWSMNFETRSGADYLAQLRDLGAILAIPSGAGRDYKVCDLAKQPYKLVDEDLSKIQRIYWVDDKPGSVHSLMQALGVRTNPNHFVAFMPVELEERLFKMELAYMGRTEEQIFETKFKCVRRPNGRYDVVVAGQTAK